MFEEHLHVLALPLFLGGAVVCCIDSRVARQNDSCNRLSVSNLPEPEELSDLDLVFDDVLVLSGSHMYPEDRLAQRREARVPEED